MAGAGPKGQFHLLPLPTVPLGPSHLRCTYRSYGPQRAEEARVSRTGCQSRRLRAHILTHIHEAEKKYSGHGRNLSELHGDNFCSIGEKVLKAERAQYIHLKAFSRNIFTF